MPCVSPTNIVEGNFGSAREVDPVPKEAFSLADKAGVEPSAKDGEEVGEMTPMKAHRRSKTRDESPCSDLTSCEFLDDLIAVDRVGSHKLFLFKALRDSFLVCALEIGRQRD